MTVCATEVVKVEVQLVVLGKMVVLEHDTDTEPEGEVVI